MALSLKHVEYGGQLVEQLMKNSTKLERVHEKLNDLISKKVTEEKEYIKLLHIADEQIKWWEKAKARTRFTKYDMFYHHMINAVCMKYTLSRFH